MLKSGEFEQMFNENKINELLSVGNLSKKQVDQLIELGKKISKNELKKRQLELSKQPGYKEHILVPLIQKILAEQGRSRDPETGRYVKKAEQPPEEREQEEEDPEDNKETKTGGLSNGFKKIAKKFIPRKMKDMFLGPKSNTSQTINSKVNTELYTKVGSSKRPKLRKGDNAGNVASKIYSILKSDIEEKKLAKEIKNNFRESKVDNEKRRHDEIMKALGHSAGDKSTSTGKKDEEVASSGAKELIAGLGLGAAALGFFTSPGSKENKSKKMFPQNSSESVTPRPKDAMQAQAWDSKYAKGWNPDGTSKKSAPAVPAVPEAPAAPVAQGAPAPVAQGAPAPVAQGAPAPVAQGAPALDMSKKKDSGLPNLVSVFDMQSKTQKLVPPADIEKEKGRYLKIKPDAATVAKPKVEATAKPASVVTESQPVPPKALSTEIIEERESSKSTKKKEKPVTEKASKVRQYYNGDFFIRDVNKKTVVMTPEVNELYDKYKIPFTSNIRTQKEQDALKHHYDKNTGQWYTKENLPVADISDHYMGDAVDISQNGLTKEMRKILEENGWYQPLPKQDPVHWRKNPNFVPKVVPPVPEKKSSSAVPVPDSMSKDKVSLNTSDTTLPENVPSLLASNDSSNSNILNPNDVMTGLLLKQISSLNMDQKKANRIQPIVIVNNSTNIIGSSKKEITSMPTDPDYNAYSPYAA